MKKIAFVSYHAPPALNAESILVWKTLRVLARMHAITLFAPVVGRQKVDPLLSVPEGVEVIRSADPALPGSFLKRAGSRALGMVGDEKLFWAKMARRGLDRDRFDILYSRSQPGASHLLALRMKAQLGLPWVAQFSDPWASNPYHSFHTATRVRQDRLAETNVIRRADWLVFPTHEIQEIYEKAYPMVAVANKSTVLPHHTSEDLYTKASGTFNRVPGKVNLAYVGDFYGERSPGPLLAAARQLAAEQPDLLDKLHIHLLGNIESKFQGLIQGSPVPVSTGKVGYFESLNAMRQADVLLLIDAPNESGHTPFLPSKLIDYLGARRPIFAITETKGTAPDILRDYGYPVARPADIPSIATNLASLLENVPTPTLRSIEPFQSDVVVAQLAELFESLPIRQG